MANLPLLQVPYRDKPAGSDGLLSIPWQQFFTLLKRVVDPLGVEKTFELANNQAAAVDIEGLAFNSDTTKQSLIEYFVQRITTGVGAVELTESGVLHSVWQVTSATWSISQGDFYPEDAGITFTITAAGKVKYTTTNVTGTPSISKISYRVRSMAG